MCFYIALAVFVFMVVFEKWTISISLALCGLPLFVKKTKLWLKKKRQEATEAEFYVLLTQLSMAMSSGMSLG
jgi:Flp pilus assembly protein TadB